MDALVKRCECCNEPVPETKRGRPQRYCSDRCRQAHRKIGVRTGNGLRYRTGRVKPKSAPQSTDFLEKFEPDNLSQKTKLHFERVNEVSFKLTDGDVTNVPASHGQCATARRRRWLGSSRSDRTLGARGAATRPLGLHPSMKQRRMHSQWRGARVAITSSKIPSTTSTDCKLACSTATGRQSDGASESVRIKKPGRSRDVS